MTMMASYVKEKHNTGNTWLPIVCFSINSAWQESTCFYPVVIARGQKLKGKFERLICQPPGTEQNSLS